MEKLIKIISSPFTPPIEVVGNIVIKIHMPYSDKDVTIQVNSSVEDYTENNDQPSTKVRQVVVTSSTDDTRTVKLDFENNNIQVVDVGGEQYEIKLMNISKENLDNQDFPCFEFFVKQISK